MNAATEKTTVDALEKVTDEKKPVSVYSLSFAPIISDEEREFLMSRIPVQIAEPTLKQSNFSKAVFSWRNAAIAAALFTVGVLHFAFQMSFIRSEVSENRPKVEVPPVKTEPVREQPVEIRPVAVESEKLTEKVADRAPVKLAPAVRKPQSESAPVKPLLKKKEAVEAPGERLRRVEKALTGV